VSQLELLAMATLNGNILLYSVVKSDLHSTLTNGHEDRVNDISWLPINDSIFSCSNDKYVIEWSISTSKIKQYVVYIFLKIFLIILFNDHYIRAHSFNSYGLFLFKLLLIYFERKFLMIFFLN